MQHEASFIKYEGVTLIEVLLVLVIGGVLILLGLQTYYQLRNQQQLNGVRYNVEVLFQGLKNYYYANCIANRSYTTGKVINSDTGQLDPTANSSAIDAAQRAVNIDDLIKQGYLAGWPPFTSPPIFTEYQVQFNLYTSSVRNVNFCVNGSCKSLPTKADKNVYLWTIQVAIKISDPTLAPYYKGQLGANCVSSISDGVVIPCSQASAEASAESDYLVFERLPSVAASSSSSLWLSMPMLKSFNRQYTNDDDYAVTVDDPTYNNKTGYQNYLCGG